MIDRLFELDAAIALWVNGWQGSAALDTFFLWATELGTWIGVTAAALAFIARNPKDVRRMLVCSAIAAIAGVMNGVLKWYVQRPRPPQAVPDIRVIGPVLWGHSFPSGHTTLAFIVLGVLWHLDRRLAWLWLPCACLVGLSRVYLGVHFPSDVAAGAIIGFVPTYFLSRRLQSTEPRT